MTDRDEHLQPSELPDEDRPFFEKGRAGSLKDQRDRYDENGTDIREYAGEPVETDEGWVIPSQMNVGRDNMAGGGEWPDPDRPPSDAKDLAA